MARATPAAVPSDKPFALVVSGVHGLTISAVNALAASEGVVVGSALADARAALPGLLSKPAEPTADRRALLWLARWAGRYGPNRHRDGDDGLWIDVTGVAHLFGGEEAMLDDLIRRLSSFGITAIAGLADTLGAAHALARFGCPPGAAWALAPTGETRAALAPLPVEALGLDAPSVLLLKRLGLRHIGQLYDIPRDSLARRFRSKEVVGAVVTRLDQALGVVGDPRRPMSAPPVLTVFRAFADPLISSDGLESEVAELCGQLSRALAEQAFGAKAVRLSLYRADGTTAKIFAMMRAPVCDGPHMLLLLKEKLACIDAGLGVDLVRLDAVRVERLSVEQSGFASVCSSPQYDAQNLNGLIDRLANRLGAEAVTVIRPRATYIPERADVRVPALHAPRYEPPWPYGARQACRENQRAEIWRRGGQRPAFLLSRPEPIDVLAEVPDGPPVRFTWRRVERRVARAEGPERIAPEWWRHLEAPPADPVDAVRTKRPRPRDYYRIEDQVGAAYWVFRHGLYAAQGDDSDDPPRWFLHGVFA
jgi:protein ImuB